MFVYLPTAPTGLSLSGLAVEAVDVEDVATPYDLQLHVWPHDGELAGFLHYNTDLFEDATIDRLVAHCVPCSSEAWPSPTRRFAASPCWAARKNVSC